jgi:hypothetical protein
MEWLIKKGDIMAEVEENEFFEQLGPMAQKQKLKYVVEGPNIDIILEKDHVEYDYWDMIGTIFLDTEESAELDRQKSEYKQKLITIGVEDGGYYEG